MTKPILHQWPAAARFGRVVPKTKFYEHGSVSTSLRYKFVADIQRITWAYKLADETIHLRGTDDVPEIQIFVIDAKEEDVRDEVLTAIDKAVPFPIIFEINRADNDPRTRIVAAHKELSAGKPKLGPYISTSWISSDSPRTPLPTALDLPTLYAALVAPILPTGVRAGEQLAEASERLVQVRKLEREIKTLERRMRNEPQFNRKVELQRDIKARTADLKSLTDSETPSPETTVQEDARWTS